MNRQPLSIPNAAHWLNHSHVLIKGRMTAGDAAEIANGVVQIEMSGNTPVMITKAGLNNILKVRRMVVPGSIVAVMLEGGETYEVSLPDETENLFPDDLGFICEQIDAKSKPLSAKEQQDFLASANGRSETTSPPTNLSLLNSLRPSS